MEDMNGAEATIVGAYDTSAYAVTYTPTTGGPEVRNHKWAFSCGEAAVLGAHPVFIFFGEEAPPSYGWIDSKKETFDEKTWLQQFIPRGAKSIWSKVNKEKAELFIKNGRMKPSGMKAIEIVKQNGQWDGAYEPQSRATIPEDFEIELNKSSIAKAFFATLDSRN